MSRTGPAAGTLEGDHVVVADPAEATRMHNKSGVGEPGPGNRLVLSRVEAAHELTMGRLHVPGLGLADLLTTEGTDGPEVHYLAYRDLRARGLLVRHDGETDLVWPRGKGRQDDPWFRLRVASERDPVHAADLQVRSELPLVLAVVDEDGGVTYYETEAAQPTGRVPAGPLSHATGRLLHDRVLVEDPVADYAREAIGTPHEDGAVLSLMEAAYLRRRGVLDVPEVEAVAAQRQHHFPRTFPVYLALRGAGVVARSGFRFGTHLRAYQDDPDKTHARWLIQCAAPDEALHWSELSRAVRLAHGVRKEFLLAATDPVRFVRLAWFRP